MKQVKGMFSIKNQRLKHYKNRVWDKIEGFDAFAIEVIFALPIMDQVLQTVASLEMMSFLDGFLGYNQIEVAEDDQHKTTFTTPWETFAYKRMPFGLINVGATFQ